MLNTCIPVVEGKTLNYYAHFLILSVLRNICFTNIVHQYVHKFTFTKLYLPINIVWIDERTKNLFFLAGEENIIEIYPNGK
ncbi:DUF6888 family protein [Nostoc sp.]|uniref:DUF6888 family protein n=1 Tax=Nostoc sp. TaxID=1180 RepID=UPI003FA57D08